MISLVFDVVITILLVVTIGFCVLLGGRLKRLRADEQIMRAVVADIVQSTGKAEHAIRTLKATADECEHTLGVQLRDAEIAIHDIRTTTSEAETVARRMAEVVAIAKSARLTETRKPDPAPEAANAAPAEQTVIPVAVQMTDMVPAEEDAAPRPDEPQAAPAPTPAPVSALQALRARAA